MVALLSLKDQKLLSRQKQIAIFVIMAIRGMGTAGMGDCLAGTILSLITLANKADRVSSVLFATGIHSLAADLIKKETGEIGLLASQVIIKINKLLNEIKVK